MLKPPSLIYVMLRHRIDGIPSSLPVLPDPRNIGVAVGISLLLVRTGSGSHISRICQCYAPSTPGTNINVLLKLAVHCVAYTSIAQITVQSISDLLTSHAPCELASVELSDLCLDGRTVRRTVRPSKGQVGLSVGQSIHLNTTLSLRFPHQPRAKLTIGQIGRAHV